MAAFGLPGGKGPNQATEFALPVLPFADAPDPAGRASGIKNNGSAVLDLASYVGASFLLHAMVPLGIGMQANQAEYQPGPQELFIHQSAQQSVILRAQQPTQAAAATNQPKVLVLDAAQVEAYPSRLLKAQAPGVAAATNQPRILSNALQWVETPESGSWSQYLIEFDPPILKPIVGTPERPQEFPSFLLKAAAPTAAAAVGINPRVITTPIGDVQAQPSGLLRAFDTTVAVGNRPRVLFGIAPEGRFEEFPSKLLRAFEPQGTINVRLISTQPDTTAFLAPPQSTLLRAFDVTPPVIAGINPRVIVLPPQDNTIDQLFVANSRLTIPNHVEPFVPPPPPPDDIHGGATIGDPYAAAIIAEQVRELNDREQHEADRRQRDQLRAKADAELAKFACGPESARAPVPEVAQVRANKAAVAVSRAQDAEAGVVTAALEQRARQLEAVLEQRQQQAEADRQAQLLLIVQVTQFGPMPSIPLEVVDDEDDLEAILAVLQLL